MSNASDSNIQYNINARRLTGVRSSAGLAKRDSVDSRHITRTLCVVKCFAKTRMVLVDLL